jgi:hypothetical protein
MTAEIHEWLRRKLASGATHYLGLCSVAYEYNQVVGPRSIYGKVRLSFEPNDKFAFESRVVWPPGINYDTWVIDGILDALIGFRHSPIIGVRCSLDEIGWHDVDSAPIGYYQAAKRAVASLLNDTR